MDEKPTGQMVTSINRSVIKDTGFSIAEIITFSPGVTVQQADGPRDVLRNLGASLNFEIDLRLAQYPGVRGRLQRDAA